MERDINYYDYKRIKKKPAGMSPVEYRIHTRQSAAGYNSLSFWGHHLFLFSLISCWCQSRIDISHRKPVRVHRLHQSGRLR
ncbi:IS3 family transposase [Peribacillus sp. SCS-37]|uniref:IS3 family transposase n=1 Tax=Paraperibacillus esterisolvens TaxID=3115296 RepID=UPI00390647B8